MTIEEAHLRAENAALRTCADEGVRRVGELLAENAALRKQALARIDEMRRVIEGLEKNLKQTRQRAEAAEAERDMVAHGAGLLEKRIEELEVALRTARNRFNTLKDLTYKLGAARNFESDLAQQGAQEIDALLAAQPPEGGE